MVLFLTRMNLCIMLYTPLDKRIEYILIFYIALEDNNQINNSSTV